MVNNVPVGPPPRSNPLLPLIEALLKTTPDVRFSTSIYWMGESCTPKLKLKQQAPSELTESLCTVSESHAISKGCRHPHLRISTSPSKILSWVQTLLSKSINRLLRLVPPAAGVPCIPYTHVIPLWEQ